MQWCWIYQVLKSPAKAATNSQSNFFEKVLLTLITLLTILIINDFLAIFLDRQDRTYKHIIEVLLVFFDSSIIASFIVLYVLFIRFIRSDTASFDFLRC